MTIRPTTCAVMPWATLGMRAIRATRNTTRLALTAIFAAASLLTAGVHGAAASPAATTKPTNTCWLDVVNDWLDHNGRIEQLYPIPCYTQAIQHLNEYPDIQQYSNAIDDIHRALLAAIHEEGGNGPGSGPTSSGGGSSSQAPSGPTGGSRPPSGPTGGSQSPSGPTGGSQSPTKGSGGSHSSPIATAFHPSSAQSVPLPLIVLGALAVLLVLAGAGTWFARRLQARRMTPAAAAPAPPRHR